MQRLDLDQVRQLSASPTAFEVGRQAVLAHQVDQLTWNVATRTASCEIKGHPAHRAQVVLDEQGQVARLGCSCVTQDSQMGACAHVTALLICLCDPAWQQAHLAADEEACRALLACLEGTGDLERQRVHLEPWIQLDGRGGGVLSLRIGMGKRYVVRDIPALLAAVEEGRPMRFGQKYAYDPASHTFSPEGFALLSYLKQWRQGQQAMGVASPRGGALLYGRHLRLTEHMLLRLLDALSGTAHLSVDAQPWQAVRIHRGPVPLSVALKMEDGVLVLQAAAPGELLPVCAGYLLCGEGLYAPPESQRALLEPLRAAMGEGRQARFVLTGELADRFLSEGISRIAQVGELTMDETVSARLIREPLQAKVYLDREGMGIIAGVRFAYGAHEINPFAPGAPMPLTEGILMRDGAGEKAIIEVLSRWGFVVQVGRAHLSDEEALYGFLTEGLPQLQAVAQVYYSEDFKGLKIRRNSRASGSVRLLAAQQWLELTLQVEDLSQEELIALLAAWREKRKYFRLKDGSFLSLDGENQRVFFDQLAGFSEALDLASGQEKDGAFLLPVYRATQIEDLQQQYGIRLQSNGSVENMLSRLRHPEVFHCPKNLDKVLRPYQKTGFSWMATLDSCGLGGILADDMGLGKTVQVIALLQWAKLQTPGCCSLVVAPTSLVHNWQAEVEKFAPGMVTRVLGGDKASRVKALEDLEGVDLLLTSYPLVRRDYPELAKITFRYLILDEAQNIKNHLSVGAQAVKELSATRRLALTGTPMENSLDELWSIFDFLLPGFLGQHTSFAQRFAQPIAKGDQQAQRVLSRRIRPFILRRLKQDVLRELPGKIEHNMMAELTADQRKAYQLYLAQARKEVDAQLKQHGASGSHIRILSCITRLRQICCHPALFLENYTGESGKMQLLEEVVSEALAGGHRVLLFSQFTSMLQLIRARFNQMGVVSMYLDGSTPPAERVARVNDFNRGQAQVFLVSLKAGGTGLNLTGADTVIHVDPWWNPAAEDQATDRAHRIGQHKVVHVIRLITRGTIEEKIIALQRKKRALTGAVIQAGEVMLGSLSPQEIRSLFADDPAPEQDAAAER
ncbi:MAG: SNF2 helicase associated domain-containing protein [Christensenellales bacterium]|jgi:superfamily II DNA or RNA helicase